MFFVESVEAFALCPHCGEPLEYHSRVVRAVKDITGKESVYIIRVLKCVNEACPTKYHRELPNMIIPYKRFDAESFEEALNQDGTLTTIAAEESTIWRWRKWFALNAVNIMMALISVAAVIGDNVKSSALAIKKQNSNKPMETIKKILARQVYWLNETVRLLVNFSKWKFNRSAFLSG